MSETVRFEGFEWDADKEQDNFRKHGIKFIEAARVFADPNRFLDFDAKHSSHEERWLCVGMVDDRVMTVRYTLRGSRIRIIGAGYWRKKRKHYEKKTQQERFGWL